MTTSKIASMITAKGVTVFYGGRPYLMNSDHPNFKAAVAAIQSEAWDSIPALFDIAGAVRAFILPDSAFTLEGAFLCLEGKPFTKAVTDKIRAMLAAGQPAAPLFKFLRNVRRNPRVAAQDELLLFCEANGFMIDEHGFILAYKSVRGDYSDIHSGKFFNRPGLTISMDANAVDPDRTQTCSTGFHFAAYDYATSWAGSIDGVNRRLLIMRIDPADVVAIPNDYHNQKGRCWRYEVLCEVDPANVLDPSRQVMTDTYVKSKDVDVAKKRAELETAIDEGNQKLDSIGNELTRVTAKNSRIRELGGIVPDGEMDREDELTVSYNTLGDSIDLLYERLGDLPCEDCDDCDCM